MTELQEKLDKVFSCGCREWTLSPNDLTNQEPDAQDLKLHDCAKITVYQKHGKINRLFVKK